MGVGIMASSREFSTAMKEQVNIYLSDGWDLLYYS